MPKYGQFGYNWSSLQYYLPTRGSHIIVCMRYLLRIIHKTYSVTNIEKNAFFVNKAWLRWTVQWNFDQIHRHYRFAWCHMGRKHLLKIMWQILQLFSFKEEEEKETMFCYNETIEYGGKQKRCVWEMCQQMFFISSHSLSLLSLICSLLFLFSLHLFIYLFFSSLRGVLKKVRMEFRVGFSPNEDFNSNTSKQTNKQKIQNRNRNHEHSRAVQSRAAKKC